MAWRRSKLKSEILKRGVVAIMIGVFIAAMTQSSLAKTKPPRDYVSVIAPRTTYPLLSTASDHFGEETLFKFPRIEITDTNTAFKLLCGGRGSEFPDLALTNREMNQKELNTCTRHGVNELSRLHIGYDAIALAAFETSFTSISPENLFLALAQNVPASKRRGVNSSPGVEIGPGNDQSAALISNPFKSWREIDPSLPDQPIGIAVPPEDSVAFDLFLNIILTGCRTIPQFAALEERSKSTFRRRCVNLRKDDRITVYGAELGKSLTETSFPQGTLIALAQAMLERFNDRLFGLAINGQAPTIEGINSGKYPGARPVHAVFRNSQLGVVPGLREFVSEITGDAAAGLNGYLRKLGFVPLTEEQHLQTDAVLEQIVHQENVDDENAEQASGPANISLRARLREIDIELWEKVRNTRDPNEIKLYIDLLPDGMFARRAKERERELRQAVKPTGQQPRNSPYPTAN